MTILKTDIEGLLVIEPRVFKDGRGYFFESFSKQKFQDATGVAVDFVQDNEALSTYGVLRGLHFQRGEHSQAKLVRVSVGKVLDVAVDIRPSSLTFGRHFSIELSSENFLQMYIPRGFAHGYVVLSETAVFQYKTDNYYCPESEGAILWNDPVLDIDWWLPSEDIILSGKDSRNPSFTTVQLL